MPDTQFDLVDFLPYLLNQAAEQTSMNFQADYKARFGFLRTEWRVMFHLGRYGDMTAREICDRARQHKTKVSRAVKALEGRRFLTRTEMPHDRRNELLSLTKSGRSVFQNLFETARAHDAALKKTLTAQEAEILQSCLKKLAGLNGS
jgi:DNA-binding MarR family transcriptional regulator